MSITNRVRRKNIYTYVIVFIIPVIMIAVHMIIDNCYPFGSNSILLGDANTQYYAFFKEMSERIRNGQSIFFSWDKGLGYDFYTNFCYYLASPFNLLALAFGSNYTELGMIITMVVQVGFCGVAMTYYLLHTKRNTMNSGLKSNAMCVTFGLVYSMCDFIMAYQYNLIWLISLMLAPIVMLGVEKLVESGDVRLYFISLVLAFLGNYYFSWFICMLAVFWYIDIKKDSFKTFIRRGTRFAITSIVAAVSASIVLIPCFNSALSRQATKYGAVSYNVWEVGNIADYLQSFFWGTTLDNRGSSMFGRNQYVGIFVIILACCYLASKKIDRLSRIKRSIEILFLMFSMNFAFMVYALHGFAWPHLFSCRFAFIFVIFLIISSFEFLENYSKLGYIRTGILLGLCVVAYIYVFSSCSSAESLACYMVTILVSAYLFMILLFSCRGSITEKYVLINFLVIGIIEILSNSIYANLDLYDVDLNKKVGSQQWSSVYESVDDDELNRKTSWIGGRNNIAYSDTNIFSSSVNTNIIGLFDSVGLTYQKNSAVYVYKGSTPVTSIMFNVRNVLSDRSEFYGGFSEIETYSLTDEIYEIDKEYGLYTADYTAGLGYICPYSILEWNLEGLDPFKVQNEYVERISGVENVFTHVDIGELKSFSADYSACILLNEDADNWNLEGQTNAYKYTNVTLDANYNSSILFEFTVPRDMQLYAYLADNNLVCDRVYIDGKDTGYNEGYPSLGVTLYLGDLKKGQKVTIEAINNSTQLQNGITYIDFYEYHDDKMQEFADYLQDKVMTVETVEDTYVKGTVTAAEDGILYTSIPYYRGWKAYVDGEETEIVQLAEGALMGLDISAGEHTIEFRYCTYGFKLGLLISCGGIGIAAVYMVVSRRKRRRDEK